MTLSKEEIEMIQHDAEELYPGWKGGGAFTNKANHIASLQQEAHCRCAVRYEAKLKAERERAGKLMEALEELAKWCTPDDRWNYMAALENAQKLINEYNNKP